MKKLTLFVLLFVTAISFANNVESNSLLEKATEANQLELSASDDEDFACALTTTRIFYRMAKRRVLSMDTGETLTEVTVVIDSICTTCYHYDSTPPTTTCVNY
ncbi:MAG: hypothetical protein ACOVLC_11580 [Flavobacterium sp.]